MKKLTFCLSAILFLNGYLFGQVAGYSFNNGNANDEIGNNHGTVSGASLTFDRFGNANHAYLFDGVDDNINFGDDPAFQMGTGSFSVSLWIKTDSIVPTGDILGKKNTSSGDNYNQYSLSFNNSAGLIQGALRGNAGSSSNHTLGSNAIDTTGWNHIVLTYDTACDCSSLYINNTLTDSDTLDLAPSTFDVTGFPLVLGWRNAQSDYPFKGVIDDLYIYKTSLTNAQIDSLYSGPNIAGIGTTKTQNLVTAYPNPTTGLIYLTENASLIKVYTLTGKLISSFNNTNTVDLSNLSRGIYLIEINTPKDVQTERLIIE
ncbi:LamG-like jellyroll fold domain-containing protein [Parvicella tangerina]|uniref:Secretion system C-terminal sorting domain-containing protein n=1 Tax=Parvicella tangerina TaxID=2829795 RepID=A0A916NH03_9FLAO|nr:LamG-like jellyroll fold domain-containing protein [Parvicella tangerina]CAG5081693.1 hypothetical protein CRYO30217_01704 [Parvicella tangerina]